MIVRNWICVLFSSSVVGVLKSILQIFCGMFAFDRLVMTGATIFGISLSLIGGTLFSYLEYTNKHETKQTVERDDLPIKDDQT